MNKYEVCERQPHTYKFSGIKCPEYTYTNARVEYTRGHTRRRRCRPTHRSFVRHAAHVKVATATLLRIPLSIHCNRQHFSVLFQLSSRIHSKRTFFFFCSKMGVAVGERTTEIFSHHNNHYEGVNRGVGLFPASLLVKGPEERTAPEKSRPSTV